MSYLLLPVAKGLNTPAEYTIGEKMTGEEKEGEKEKGVNPSASGVNDAQEIFNGAENARHREHAEELLAKLIDEKLLPLESNTWFKFDEAYGDFQILVPWWDYDEGAAREVGTLSAVVRFVDRNGKFLSGQEIERQVEEIRKDLQQKIREREERAKEVKFDERRKRGKRRRHLGRGIPATQARPRRVPRS